MFYKCIRQFRMPRYEEYMWYTILRGSIWEYCGYTGKEDISGLLRLQNGNDYIELPRSGLVANFRKFIPYKEMF